MVIVEEGGVAIPSLIRKLIELSLQFDLQNNFAEKHYEN